MGRSPRSIVFPTPGLTRGMARSTVFLTKSRTVHGAYAPMTGRDHRSQLHLRLVWTRGKPGRRPGNAALLPPASRRQRRPPAQHRGRVCFSPIMVFREITVCGDYTDQPATADHKELIFTAIR